MENGLLFLYLVIFEHLYIAHLINCHFCVCVYSCVYASMCICVHAYVEARDLYQMSSLVVLWLIFWNSVSHWKWSSPTDQTHCLRRNPFIFVFSTLRSRCVPPCIAFHVSVGNSNSGLSDCMASNWAMSPGLIVIFKCQSPLLVSVVGSSLCSLLFGGPPSSSQISTDVYSFLWMLGPSLAYF